MLINPEALVATAVGIEVIKPAITAEEIFSYWRSLSHLYGSRRASELTAEEFGLSESDIRLVISACYQRVAAGTLKLT